MVTDSNLEQRLARYRAARSTLPAREWHDAIRVSLRGRWVYVENAKVGCTTIKKTLYLFELADSPLSQVPRYSSVHTDQLHDSLYGPTLSLAQLPELDALEAITGPSFYRFSFVRNPFTRTLSAYLHMIAQTDKAARARFMRAAKLDPSQDIEFSEFLEHLNRKPKLLRLDKHWRPQVHNLASIEFDWLGHFERFDEDLTTVLTVIASRAPEVYEGIEPTVARQATHQTNAGSRLAEFYGPREADLIRKLYKDDFQQYGYHDSLDAIA